MNFKVASSVFSRFYAVERSTEDELLREIKRGRKMCQVYSRPRLAAAPVWDHFDSEGWRGECSTGILNVVSKQTGNFPKTERVKEAEGLITSHLDEVQIVEEHGTSGTKKLEMRKVEIQDRSTTKRKKEEGGSSRLAEKVPHSVSGCSSKPNEDPKKKKIETKTGV